MKLSASSRARRSQSSRMRRFQSMAKSQTKATDEHKLTPISALFSIRVHPCSSVAMIFRLLRFEFLEDQCSVGAAEAERIRQRVADSHGTGVVGHIVEIALGIRVVLID